MLECDPDWAPSLNLGHTEVKAATTARFDRLSGRARSKQLPSSVLHNAGPLTEVDNAAEFHAATNIAETAVEMEPEQISQHNDEAQQECRMCSLRLKEIAHLQEENRKLKEELSKKKLDDEFLKDNDSKVKFYTGLPSFALLMGVLMQIRPSLPNTDRKISHFQMLLLTLMRLRLNLPLEHIAHLFDISRTTTSTVFNNTIHVLYAHLSPLVHWPVRHCIQASMPHQYVEMFGDRVTVIIDCFELFIEQAQNLRAKAETYSNYKKRHWLFPNCEDPRRLDHFGRNSRHHSVPIHSDHSPPCSSTPPFGSYTKDAPVDPPQPRRAEITHDALKHCFFFQNLLV
uniref:Transposase Helix-turn-helix domain-containing protein n=1 Tax=Neogobius melanostomus TaxID=47308 RepID=A0A8C6SS83_9GOBI